VSRIFVSLGRRFPVLVRIRELFPLTPLGLTVAAAAAGTAMVVWLVVVVLEAARLIDRLS